MALRYVPLLPYEDSGSMILPGRSTDTGLQKKKVLISAMLGLITLDDKVSLPSDVAYHGFFKAMVT